MTYLFQKNIFFLQFILPILLLASNSDLCFAKQKRIPATNNTELEEKVRGFMLSHKLILPGDESAQGDYAGKWFLYKTTNYKGKTLLIMNLGTFYKKELQENGQAYEVVVIEGDHLKLFEDSFNLPKEALVAFGSPTPDIGDDNKPFPFLPKDLYYAKVTKKSLVHVFKSFYAGLQYVGLSADLDGSKKAPFDLTPKRKWKLKNVQFDLRRGNTPEINDVRPGQIDDNFKAYFEGSAGHIAPWVAGAVRKIKIDGNWADVIPELNN